MAIQFETQNVMQIFVQGRAYAQTRARHNTVERADGSRGVQVYSSASKGLKAWRKALVDQFKLAIKELGLAPLDGALCVDMAFQLAIKDRKRWGQVCHTKPDKDNLEKAVLDCMGEAGLFTIGDSQVGVGQTCKLWCAADKAGVLVKVMRVRVAEKSPAADGGASPEWMAKG